MGNYYLHRESVLVQTGHCQDGDEELHVRDGLSIGFGIPPAHIQFPTPPEKSYATLRRESYPALTDLADALYWQANGDASKMVAYMDKITLVKQLYPKPVGV